MKVYKKDIFFLVGLSFFLLAIIISKSIIISILAILTSNAFLFLSLAKIREEIDENK